MWRIKHHSSLVLPFTSKENASSVKNKNLWYFSNFPDISLSNTSTYLFYNQLNFQNLVHPTSFLNELRNVIGVLVLEEFGLLLPLHTEVTRDGMLNLHN